MCVAKPTLDRIALHISYLVCQRHRNACVLSLVGTKEWKFGFIRPPISIDRDSTFDSNSSTILYFDFGR
ncbi:hypothetical protein AUR66_16855 [Haloferax profundi]|uniref:Uncharacterized protein n=1 Tax=Haloferax profundi TaxID=1544718 RepID=A0A0W1S936_9EURY|nr:hypothetical protein AUR66_16855 [Haloferax profundi]